MASTGKKGKKNKGKTVPLNDFLSTTSQSWIDQVNEADMLGEFNWKPALPAAPRAARELDESRIPKNPPYIAYLLNLSYELEESDILDAFSDLKISNVRLPRDDRSGRLKGFGYVEFNDRSSFISALQKHEATIRGRRITIDVAESEGERRRGGMRDNKDRDSNYDPEKTSGDWRSGPRSEFAGNDDRRGPTFGRKEYGGFRDRDRDRDREGFDRSKGDREPSWRTGEKRFGVDRDRDGRGSYGSRRGYDSDNYSEPKTRTKLNLKPRTVPIEEVVVKEEPPPKKEERPEKEKPSAASIFGQAKPVDTAAREREIEERLAKEKGARTEKDPDSSKHSDSENTGESLAKSASKFAWAKKSQKTEAQNPTSWGSGSEQTDDLDEPPPADESEKETSENVEEPSRYSESKKYEESENDRDGDDRRAVKYDNRYNERNRESDRSYRRDDKWRDDRERRDRKDDRRDRGYDSDRRGVGSAGRNYDQERDGDSRRFSERDSDHRRFSNDRETDNKRYQERDSGRHRDQDDYGSNKGPRGDRRGAPSSGDKPSRLVKITQEKERGPQNKDKLRDQKKSEEGIRMPKLREAEAPNYIGTNKYSFLEEDGVSE